MKSPRQFRNALYQYLVDNGSEEETAKTIASEAELYSEAYEQFKLRSIEYAAQNMGLSTTKPGKKPYTGHYDRLINGKTLVEHIKPIIEQERNFYSEARPIEMPTDEQIAIVITSLRMHGIMMHASQYNFSELMTKRQKATEFYPIQSSIGRFLRDAATVTLDEWRLKDE